MKNLFLLSFFSLILCMIIPQTVNAQAHSIALNRDQNKDSLYVMLTDTIESKYRWGKGKFYPTQQAMAQRTFDGCRTYSAVLNQASTTAPTATVLRNTLVGTPVITRDSIGTYKLTKTAAFTSAKTSVMATIGNASGFELQSYRQSDSTVIVRCLSKLGIGADLGGTATLEISVWP